MGSRENGIGNATPTSSSENKKGNGLGELTDDKMSHLIVDLP